MALRSLPSFKPFTLALIQLGSITANKHANLQHARDMVIIAASNEKKPDLIVLPVRPRPNIQLGTHVT